jgi:hypothetical protein
VREQAKSNGGGGDLSQRAMPRLCNPKNGTLLCSARSITDDRGMLCGLYYALGYEERGEEKRSGVV